MAVGMALWMVAALVILTTTCIVLWSSKGLASMPFIGDTVQFFRGPRVFLVDHFTRFGDPFQMSFLGKKITVVNSPEAIRFVLSTAHGSFSQGYHPQFVQLMSQGKFTVASLHPHNRKAVLNAVTGGGLQSLVPFVSAMAAKTVEKWGEMEVVNTAEEVAKYVFKVGMHVIWRDIDPNSDDMEVLRKSMAVLLAGALVVPINLPGFYFHKAVKTREMVVSRIQESISKRRAAGTEVNDVMNALINNKEVEVLDYDICCIMITLIFSSSATTASLLPFVLKYLHDFPEVRQRVQEEQEGIREKIVEDKSLTWFKPKSSMPYTLQVINEVLRMETIAAFVPRRANNDVDFNGYVFRKGSYVWASLASILHNPDYYPNPQEFNPSRFEEKPKPNSFMVFGQGPHLCPGSELTITETMFLVHHLITNYSWERYGPEQGATHMPISKLGGGFPVTLVKK